MSQTDFPNDHVPYMTSGAKHAFTLMACVFAVLLTAAGFFADSRLDADAKQNAKQDQTIKDLSATNRRLERAVKNQRQESIDRVRGQCEASNTGRAALQSVLDQVSDPPASGAAAIDFSQVPGWSALNTEIQFFLTNLSVALQSTNPTYLAQVAESYRQSNPQQDCMKLVADLKEKLDEQGD